MVDCQNACLKGSYWCWVVALVGVVQGREQVQHLGLMKLSRFLCIEGHGVHSRITGFWDHGRPPWISSSPCLAPRMAAASRWLLEFDIMAIGSFFKQGRWMVIRRLELAALVILLNCFSCCATLEGDALISMSRSWQRTFTTWVGGTDPCVNWEGVTCSGGQVTNLNLTNTGLSGPISLDIGQLTSLVVLDLSFNNVNGPFPQELTALQNLQVLNLGRCNLNMTFSLEVLQLGNLTELRMDVAGVSGPIPDAISNLKNLQILYLGNNSLVGPLPAASLGSLVKLQQLTLWGGRFASPIPPEFGNLINLQYLNLHDCNLWGGLPASWSNMKSINKMLLYANDLTGYIPSSWQSLTTLRILHIGNNALSGPFPDWIVNLSIEQLDMSRNSFQGPFPDFNSSMPLVKSTRYNISLYCNYFNGSYPSFQLGNLVNYTGNCFTNVSTRDTDNTRSICNRQFFCRDFFARIVDGCAPCPSGNYIYDNITICTCKAADYVEAASGSGSKVFPYGAVIGGIVGALAILLLLVALCKWDPVHKRLPFDPFFLFHQNDDDDDWIVPEGVHKFTLAELAKATGNFNSEHEIGAGGFGKVFVGNLVDGKTVAIKRASSTSLQGHSEFRNEVVLLSRLHHRNLVRLEGFCEEQELQILVYEYMKNGNLHDRLLRAKGGVLLGWYKRLEITVGIAQGLDYLHSFADPPVIHRDIKPSNILLDEYLNAKVADFGISKETMEFNTHISTRPAGTAGYLDPEYFLRRQLTTASDVYGFGVVVLEVITGQESIDHTRKEEFNLVEWAKPRFRDGGIESIVDPALEGDYNAEVFSDMTNVALVCASFSKNDRPSMKDVVNYLEPHVRAFQPSCRSTEASHSQPLEPLIGKQEGNFSPVTRESTLSSLRKMGFGTEPSKGSVEMTPILKQRYGTW